MVHQKSSLQFCTIQTAFKSFSEESVLICGGKEIEREGHSIQFIDVDYDENDLADKYGVQALPTTIIVEGDKEVERFVGALSKKEVLDKLV